VKLVSRVEGARADARAKKPYRKPTLVVHGDVSRITGFIEGNVGGRRPRIGRLYHNS
jgi:hypothetical protein